MKRAAQAGSGCFARSARIELSIPALAERSDDILPLCESMLAQEQNAWRLGDDARAALLAHDWPGNVRELQDRLQRATLVGRDGVIHADDLGLAQPARIRTPERHEPEPPSAAEPGGEREQTQAALVRAKGVVPRRRRSSA